MSRLVAMPIIPLGSTTTVATLKHGAIWRNGDTTQIHGRISVWDAPVGRSVPPHAPTRASLKVIEATLAAVKRQLRSTPMRHASTALIARHARQALRGSDPQLVGVSGGLVSDVVESVRQRLSSEPWTTPAFAMPAASRRHS